MRAASARTDAAASSCATLSIEAITPVNPIHAALPGGGATALLTSAAEGIAEPTTALIDPQDTGMIYRADATVVRTSDRINGYMLDRRA
jgi:hypothetical protein